jgi:hypothetical protein
MGRVGLAMFVDVPVLFLGAALDGHVGRGSRGAVAEGALSLFFGLFGRHGD